MPGAIAETDAALLRIALIAVARQPGLDATNSAPCGARHGRLLFKLASLDTGG